MTITEAYNKLQALLGDKPYCVSYECWNHHVDRGPESTWTIWDGSTHHEDRTLEGAFRRCEQAHAPKLAILTEDEKAFIDATLINEQV